MSGDIAVDGGVSVFDDPAPDIDEVWDLLERLTEEPIREETPIPGRHRRVPLSPDEKREASLNRSRAFRARRRAEKAGTKEATHA